MNVVRFPQERCRPPVEQTEPVVVLILPVIRVERRDTADDALDAWLMDWSAENA